MKKIFVAIATLCLLTGWSCGKFDDSALNGRIDDLEGRVDGLEAEIEALNAKLDGFNNALRGITDALNGGLITKVERNATDDGWVFTVSNAADGTSKTYEVKDGEGKEGPKGDKGDAPVITTGYDSASGRYYWIIDGNDYAPNYKWATGAKGDQGEPGTGEPGTAGKDGVTPWLAIAAASAADESKPDFTNSEDSDDLYWWVSYDYKGEGDRANYNWEKLYTANTTAVKLNLSVEYTGDELIFYNDGQEIGRAEVKLSDNPLSITFTLGEAELEAYSTVRFYNGAEKTITVKVEGASENAVIKAELQNNNGSHSIEIDGMDITVTALQSGVNNKLLVEVLDGSNCYHSWIDINNDIPAANIYLTQTDDYDYLPVAFGEGYENMNNIPVKPEVVVEIDMPAVEDITFNVTWNDDEPDAAIANARLNSNTVTIKKGETSALVDFEIYSREGLVCDTYGYFELSVEDEKAVLPTYPQAWLCIANNFHFDVKLTESDLSCEWSHSSGTLGRLVDGDLGTYWESKYSTEEDIYTDPIYGVRIDVKAEIPAGAVVTFRHYPRNYNVAPVNVAYGFTASTTTLLGENTYDTTVEWKSAVYQVSEKTQKVIFGLTESAQGNLKELHPGEQGGGSWCHCAGLMEIEVYYMY